MTAASSRTVSDQDLLREVVFAFQGLNGKILIQDPDNDNRYMVSAGFVINPSVKELALRLTNLGWLFSRINGFCQRVAKEDTAQGFVLQSFAAVLSEEIVEYYRIIAIIEQQLHYVSRSDQENSDSGPHVSLFRLQVWTVDHFYRLKMLALLIEECKRKRGGALVNMVYRRMQTGDPQLKRCLTRILNQVVMPIRKMLCRWIFYGEIDDPYKEFFITHHSSSDSAGSSADTVVWHDRYQINEQLLPEFIPPAEAKKILATGKAVNLLLQSCGNRLDVLPGYEDLREAFEKTNVEEMFTQPTTAAAGGQQRPVTAATATCTSVALQRSSSSPSTPSSSTSSYGFDFRKLLHRAFIETSSKAMKILFEDHKLLEHLTGLRQFLLLGQGDFIRHLMDLLVPELWKPCHRLQTHALNSLLSQAIQATNAQFMPEEIRNRAECAFNSNIGTGWDIFSLIYQTKGPISAILTPRCMENYTRMFQHLWRSKRMEYLLTSLMKDQVYCWKRHSKSMPRLMPVLYQIHFLMQEMTHFIKQMQYYIEFEVIECSWAEFWRKLTSAQGVDEIVETHDTFLRLISARAMIDPKSQQVYEKLRSIYDSITDFESLLTSFDKQISREVTARRIDAGLEPPKTASNLSLASTASCRQDFEQETIPTYEKKVQMLSITYHQSVQEFLLLLADDPDIDMQFLSIRIDFNEHYKKRNKCLETSFTFLHRKSMDTSK
jgi:gamma-tubulin complex component 3